MSKTSTPYQPRPGTVPARVLAFFRENPEEELTIPDVSVKFGIPEHNVGQSLAYSVNAGVLVKFKSVGGDGRKRTAYRLPDLITEGACA